MGDRKFNLTAIWQVEDTDEDGYGIFDHYEWYGVWLIVFAAFGCLGNTLALCVFLHPNMRSPYGVYICALLIVDNVFLICTCLIHVPGAWLTKVNIHDPDFWSDMSRGQNIYVTAYAAAELARALVVWYTIAVLCEQYCVIYKPTLTLRFSSTVEKVLKISITVLNLVILIHLVHFFKLVLKPIDIEDINRICLSDMYINEAYRIYDVYIYFLFFVLTAWFAAVVLCSLIAAAVITSRYNIGEVLPDQKIFRVFKNGRSIRTSLALGLWFIICFAIADICYIATWFYDAWDSGDVDCHFRPGERRFINVPPFMSLLHDICVVVNSTFRFPLIYAANSNFRRILTSCFYHRPDVIGSVSSLFTVRPATIPEDQVLKTSDKEHYYKGHEKGHRKGHDNKAFSSQVSIETEQQISSRD